MREHLVDRCLTGGWAGDVIASSAVSLLCLPGFLRCGMLLFRDLGPAGSQPVDQVVRSARDCRSQEPARRILKKERNARVQPEHEQDEKW